MVTRLLDLTKKGALNKLIILDECPLSVSDAR